MAALPLLDTNVSYELSAISLWAQRPKLSLADSYQSVMVARLKLPAIITFDRDFDDIPGVERPRAMNHHQRPIIALLGDSRDLLKSRDKTFRLV